MIQDKAIACPKTEGVLCFQEDPIHIPGFIKSHGMLFALEEPDLTIVQLSHNTQRFLKISPETLLNQPLAKVLGTRQVKVLKNGLDHNFKNINPLKIAIKHLGKNCWFDGIAHRHNGVLILELIPALSKTPATFFNFHHLVKGAIEQMQQAKSTAELCDRTVQEFQKLTGFERVMVYKFDEDGAGAVIAEAKREDLQESYLGLHYPATDIPDEARRLFFLNKVRVIPDVNDQPVAIVPTHHPTTGKPLDLSLTMLRAVSPFHIEYLQNMGVAASLVIALINQEDLWGLIACHHYTPKSVSYELQTACEFLGQVMSLELVCQERNDDVMDKARLSSVQSNLLEAITNAPSVQEGLCESRTNLLELVHAKGCAICFNEEITLLGETPSLKQVGGLVQWLAHNQKEPIFVTNCLSEHYPSATHFKAVASGLLGITVSKLQKNYLLWFRPEVMQTVCWAGNPADTYQVDETGGMQLCPRQSFKLWQDTVQCQSLPWKSFVIEAAEDFRNALLGCILQSRTWELLQTNRKLQQEIRERKQAIETIREQAALIDISTDAIFVQDLDCQILFWSKGAEEMYGWTRKEITGKDFCQLATGPQSAQLDLPRNTVLATGEWQGELSQLTKSGEAITVDSRWILMRDETGQPKSILTVETNITQQKQLEAQFLRSQRLESLGILASGIAHDMNNILTPMLAAAQLLPTKLPHLDPTSQFLLKVFADNSKRGADLMKQILTFGRGVTGQRVPVQIKALIKDFEQIIRSTFPKSIDIVIDLPPDDLWGISADVTQLHQVLMNLCVNARDAMPEGGVLRFHLENFWVDPSFAQMHLDARVAPYVLVEVSDTGTGIAAHVQEQMFDPFFTTKAAGKGTGLGLSTVLGIIKSHGGFLKVHSQVGKGSQFKIFLPAIQTTTAPLAPEVELPRGQQELILIVDDEASIRQVTQTILETYHYRVLTVKNGMEAIACYRSRAADIQAVMMDLMMPEMDGLSTIRALRELNPQVKILATSGLGINYQQPLAELGIQTILEKPYTTTVLLQRMHQLLRG
jgi:two-component system, cell cycle sensor histidine kinase and response regulator CckA